LLGLPRRPAAPAVLFDRHRPPPPPALFPYTTLFRSHPMQLLAAVDQVVDVEHELCRHAGHALVMRHGIEQLPQLRMVGDIALDLDRKSTRQNSSPRTNLYAVFCLKKKHAIVALPLRS